MSLWQQHGMDDRIRAALDAVHLNNPDGHHLGTPYVSSYQLAITVDADDPELKQALGKAVGGMGSGSHDSLAQYIGNELSKQIKAQGKLHYAEGVFLSTESVRTITYRNADGADIVSSVPGTGYDMALFRRRDPKS